MRKLFRASATVLTIMTLLATCLMPAESSADLGKERRDRLMRDFLGGSGEKQKTDILRQVLEDNSSEAHTIFYTLLLVSDDSSLPAFRSAVAHYGQKELLGHFGLYLQSLISSLSSKYGDLRKLGPEQRKQAQQDVERATDKLGDRINSLSQELAKIARQNPYYLVTRVREGYQVFESSPFFFFGAAMSLALAQEDGFSALLASAKSEDDGGMVLMFVKSCPEHYIVVIPAIKQYENPQSTKDARLLAGVVLRSLRPSELVFAKIAEAYKQDHYFEDDLDKLAKNGKLTIDKNSIGPMFDRVARNWKLTIEEVFKGDQELVHYLGRNHLAPSKDRDSIIVLMANIHPATAAHYLAKLDLDTLDRPTTLAVVNIFMDKGLDRCSTDCKRDLFNIFNRTYGRAQKFDEHQSWMILSLDIFSQDQQETFLQKHFSGMNTGTKLLMVDRAASFEPERKKRMFAMMRKDPDKSVAVWIEDKQ